MTLTIARDILRSASSNMRATYESINRTVNWRLNSAANRFYFLRIFQDTACSPLIVLSAGHSAGVFENAVG